MVPILNHVQGDGDGWVVSHAGTVHWGVYGAAGLLLRAPQMADFVQWAQLRESSRAYLTPWEPIWPSDDLTRAGFRRRLRGR